MAEDDKKEQETINRDLVNLVQILYEQGSRMVENEHRMVALIEKVVKQSSVTAEETRQQNEQTQRNIDFIIKQQAQFAADMQQLRESQSRSEQRWERTEESVRSLHAIAQIHEREITALGESQAHTDRQMAETDERINALLNVVERLVSDRK